MQDIVTGKWCPANPLVTGKPTIIGTSYPGYTGEACPDKFGGDSVDRLHVAQRTPKPYVNLFNTPTPTLFESKLPGVRKKVEELKATTVFDRMDETREK